MTPSELVWTLWMIHNVLDYSKFLVLLVFMNISFSVQLIVRNFAPSRADQSASDEKHLSTLYGNLHNTAQGIGPATTLCRLQMRRGDYNWPKIWGVCRSTGSHNKHFVAHHRPWEWFEGGQFRVFPLQWRKRRHPPPRVFAKRCRRGQLHLCEEQDLPCCALYTAIRQLIGTSLCL